MGGETEARSGFALPAQGLAPRRRPGCLPDSHFCWLPLWWRRSWHKRCNLDKIRIDSINSSSQSRAFLSPTLWLSTAHPGNSSCLKNSHFTAKIELCLPLPPTGRVNPAPARRRRWGHDAGQWHSTGHGLQGAQRAAAMAKRD